MVEPYLFSNSHVLKYQVLLRNSLSSNYAKSLLLSPKSSCLLIEPLLLLLEYLFFCWNTNFCWWNHVNSPCFSQFSPFSPGEPRGFHSTGSHWPLQTLLHVRSMVSRWLSQLPWPNVGGIWDLAKKMWFDHENLDFMKKNDGLQQEKWGWFHH